MIEVAGLTKRFGDLAAVDDLSFTAPAGQVSALLGPTGAGKTTTFRMLLGLARPASGRALIEGRRYIELESPRQIVGAVLESSGFHPARTGRDHLRVVATAAGIPRSRVDEPAESSETNAYHFSVVLILRWPSHAETVDTCSPFASSKEP